MLNILFFSSSEGLVEHPKLKNLSWPTQEDLTGALGAMLRLQRTYRLTSRDLIRGLVDGHQSRTRLQSDDMLKLGMFAFQSDHNYAKDWFEQALFFATQSEVGSLPEKDIAAIYVHLSAIFEKVRVACTC